MFKTACIYVGSNPFSKKMIKANDGGKLYYHRCHIMNSEFTVFKSELLMHVGETKTEISADGTTETINAILNLIHGKTVTNVIGNGQAIYAAIKFAHQYGADGLKQRLVEFIYESELTGMNAMFELFTSCKIDTVRLIKEWFKQLEEKAQSQIRRLNIVEDFWNTELKYEFNPPAEFKAIIRKAFFEIEDIIWEEWSYKIFIKSMLHLVDITDGEANVLATRLRTKISPNRFLDELPVITKYLQKHIEHDSVKKFIVALVSKVVPRSVIDVITSIAKQ